MIIIALKQWMDKIMYKTPSDRKKTRKLHPQRNNFRKCQRFLFWHNFKSSSNWSFSLADNNSCDISIHVNVNLQMTTYPDISFLPTIRGLINLYSQVSPNPRKHLTKTCMTETVTINYSNSPVKFFVTTFEISIARALFLFFCWRMTEMIYACFDRWCFNYDMNELWMSRT